MNRGILGAVCAATCLLALPALAQVSIRDDLGRSVIAQKRASRIVTMAPFLTELVFAAGAGDRVVGVGANSFYPPEAAKLPAVSAARGFIVEQMAKLKPDLVLAWRDGISPEDVERISGFGAVVFVAQGRRLEDVPRLLRVIGILTGADVTPVVDDFEGRLQAIRKAYAGKPKMTAFLEIWHRPLTTISGDHFLSEALEHCAVESVFRDLTGIAPKVSWDDLVKKDPYVIVSAGSAANAEEFVKNWSVRHEVAAAKAERFVFVDAETLQRPTPRTPKGIETLCEGLERFRATMPVAPPRPAPVPATRTEPESPATQPPQRRGSQYGD